eukprot:9212-Heterococcus_DN1.PRE.2
MASGKLRCCGSSLFLKNLYGVGYNLTVVKTISNTYEEDGTLAQPDAATLAKLAGASKGIRHLVRDHVPKAEVLSDVGAEISFQLPSNASASFKALLMDIDAHTDDLCVSSYGMSVTTLEEHYYTCCATVFTGANGDTTSTAAAGGSVFAMQTEKAWSLCQLPITSISISHCATR